MPVLWAEDEASDRVLIRSAAGSSPIRFVNDGAAALVEAMRKLPRLIVLDVYMPHLNGVEALQRIRDTPGLRDVPVVMFTISQDDGHQAACRALGASFVRKPRSFLAFERAVRGILDLAA